jgi:hypothetical protein
MEIGSKTLNIKAGGKLNLYYLGDFHEGNCNMDESALREAVEIIKNDPDGYFFLMGDMIEAITHLGDKRFDPLSIHEKYNIRDLKDLPMRQAQKAFSYIKPIQHKCLAVVIGNHEEKYVQFNSSDIYGRFVDMFTTSAHAEGKPPFKVGYVGFYNIHINTRGEGHSSPYVIGNALNHGIGGGGTTEGNQINNVHKIFKYMYSDINAMGHVHTLNESQRQIVTVSSRDNLLKKKRFWFTTGCFLKTYVEGHTNYYEHMAGKRGESDVGMMKMNIKINSDNWYGKPEKIYFGD